MADKAWKAWEREVARDLGGERTGPTGFDLPDVKGVPLIAPECKYMGRMSLRDVDRQQARENAIKVGRMPVRFLKEKGTGRKEVVIEYDDFIAIIWPILIHALGHESRG